MPQSQRRWPPRSIGDVLVDQQRNAGRGQDGLDDRRAEDGVVIAHDGKALRAGDVAQNFGAAVHGAQNEVGRQRGDS